jgi:hypothetical protein
MATIQDIKGLNKKGEEVSLFIHDDVKNNFEIVKKAVKFKGWDNVIVISGLPGVGKSTIAQQICKFLDPTFNVDRVSFKARDFRDSTSHGEDGQAFMLDESFADMNTSLSKDPEFIATINHLQLIRQKHLFLVLVLPDFFSLHKNIAIFRSSFLFVVYSEDFERGTYAVFDREAKRDLYIKGKQFINYQAQEPNFYANYYEHWFIDKQEYDRRKEEHLREQAKVKEKGDKAGHQRDILAYLWKRDTKQTNKEIAEVLDMVEETVTKWVQRGEERYVSLKT